MPENPFSQSRMPRGLFKALHEALNCAAAALVLLSAALMSACSFTPEDTVTGRSLSYWESMRTRLKDISTLEAAGRLGISGQGSADFSYRCAGATLFLDLTSPLGIALGHLHVDEQGASLDNGTHVFKSARAAPLLEAVGLSLPVDTLRDLLLGLPPGEVSYDAEGRLKTASWHNWQAQYRAFSEFEGYALPVDFTLYRTSAAPESSPLKIRVLVRQVTGLH